MSADWPQIEYLQALAAFEAGQKLHLGGKTYLVRQALRQPEQGIVLWISDERTPGVHGVLLYPDGRIEAK